MWVFERVLPRRGFENSRVVGITLFSVCRVHVHVPTVVYAIYSAARHTHLPFSRGCIHRVLYFIFIFLTCMFLSSYCTLGQGDVHAHPSAAEVTGELRAGLYTVVPLLYATSATVSYT